MEYPVQLVSSGKVSKDLVINDEALDCLASETRPITVVAIIGPARTGKSYLMNRLMGKSGMFDII